MHTSKKPRDIKSITGRSFLTAADLSRICEIDLKTVHNWVDRGKIEFFRTPGKHLRFQKSEVRKFLARFSFPIPQELLNVVEAVPPSSTAISIPVPTTTLLVHNSRLKEVSSLPFHVIPFENIYEALLYAGQNRVWVVLPGAPVSDEIKTAFKKGGVEHVIVESLGETILARPM